MDKEKKKTEGSDASFDADGGLQRGTQPLDALLERLGLSNHDLVEASTEQLSHKMVSKARKGRRITANIKWKILNALNRCGEGHAFALKDLFNY